MVTVSSFIRDKCIGWITGVPLLHNGDVCKPPAAAAAAAAGRGLALAAIHRPGAH